MPVLGKCSALQMGMSKHDRHWQWSGCRCSGIPPVRIEACHRITKEHSTVIAKFTKRKDFQELWSVKKDLQKIKMEDVVLPVKTNFLLIEALFQITKFCASRVISYVVYVIFSVFAFPMTQSRSKSMRTVLRCP